MNTVKPSNAKPFVASVGVRKLTIAIEPLLSIRTSEHGLPGPVVSLKLVIRILIEFYCLWDKSAITQISSGVIYVGIPVMDNSVIPVEEALVESVTFNNMEPIP